MRQIILHIGMPKTGTTSIQESFFSGITDPRFRLVSLDTTFGNQLVGVLFQNAFEHHGSYFRSSLSDRHLQQFRRRAFRHLDRSLVHAARDGVTPILSAEHAWTFEEADYASLKQFLNDRGFEATVVCYIRAPLDFFESSFQQLVMSGGYNSWADLFEEHRFAEPIQITDRVFGRDNVSPFFFDPADFPGHCVVQHFCQHIGLAPSAVTITRVNEGLSLDALKLLYTADQVRAVRHDSLFSRLHRRLLIARLRDLPGPRMRVRPTVTDAFRTSIEPQWPWLEKRLGRRIPLSLLPREPAAEIQNEADMLNVSANALAWLSEHTGTRRAPSCDRGVPSQHIFNQLQRLAMLNCHRELAKAVNQGMRVHFRRPWL